MDSSSSSWRRSIMAVAVALASLPTIAQEVAAAPQGWNLSAGGDVRIREEAFDDIPIIRDPPGVTRGGKNDSLRFRTMLWGKAENDGVILYGRLNNEFRHWFDPSNSTSFEWPDELVIDNLYLRLVDILGEGTVLTVGRQDIMLGSKRLVLEGTPKDGSRTIYMNGVSFGAKVDDLTRIDLFGVYNAAEDELAVGNEHRDLVGYKAGFNDMDESGAGAFVSSRFTEALPFEVYYIFKHDSCYEWKPVATNPPVTVAAADYHTVGARLMPKFTSVLSGELEVAGQFGEEGDNDVEAMMGAAGLKWSPEAEYKPTLSANVIYLSGNDASTSKQEGFNPLWGRYPWISELYIYSWDAEKAGFWTNLIYPYIEATCAPAAGHKLRMSIGPLLADEKDGPAGGDERGWLGIARWDFPIKTGLLGEKDSMKGHLLAEVLEPGDYYAVDDTAYFLRWEVTYAF
jgi:hypothetical protein